jgi:hypothetical protein
VRLAVALRHAAVALTGDEAEGHAAHVAALEHRHEGRAEHVPLVDRRLHAQTAAILADRQRPAAGRRERREASVVVPQHRDVAAALHGPLERRGDDDLGELAEVGLLAVDGCVAVETAAIG